MMRTKFSIFLILLTLTFCTQPKVKPSVASISGEELPSQESWNDTIYFSENGKLQAILVTAHLREFEESKTKLLDSVFVRFYDKNEKLTSTLTADSGKVNDKKKEFTAIGNVVLKGERERVLYTDKLSWNSKTEKIYTDAKVKIVDKNETIVGEGLLSDKTLENYVIRKITFITTEKIKQ